MRWTYDILQGNHALGLIKLENTQSKFKFVMPSSTKKKKENILKIYRAKSSSVIKPDA